MAPWDYLLGCPLWTSTLGLWVSFKNLPLMQNYFDSKNSNSSLDRKRTRSPNLSRYPKPGARWSGPFMKNSTWNRLKLHRIQKLFFWICQEFGTINIVLSEDLKYLFNSKLGKKRHLWLVFLMLFYRIWKSNSVSF